MLNSKTLVYSFDYLDVATFKTIYEHSTSKRISLPTLVTINVFNRNKQNKNIAVSEKKRIIVVVFLSLFLFLTTKNVS